MIGDRSRSKVLQTCAGAICRERRTGEERRDRRQDKRGYAWPFICIRRRVQAGIFKRVGEILDLRKAGSGIFGERTKHDLLNIWGERWSMFSQQWWRCLHMLESHAHYRALERWSATQPLVDNHSQRVLITGGRWHT